jgi:hypothetical protein
VTPRRLTTLLLLAMLAALSLARSAATAPPQSPPEPSCSPEPAECFAWHTSNVTVTWASPPPGVTASGCGSATIASDTAGQAVSCTWSNAEGSKTTTANVRRDATPPRVTGSAERQPDANGWYNHPIRFQFSGEDGMSGVESCGGVTYTGPDTATARITGSCRDRAGNTGTTVPFEFKYDTKPPRLGKVRAKMNKDAVVLTWTASKDTYSVVVLRRPGLRGSKPSTLSSRPGRSFTDRRLKSGVRYRYAVTAYDAAGNGVTTALVAQLGGSTAEAARVDPTVTHALTRPADEARVTAPPALVWATVPGATYYNVQLFRGNRKVLSAWPRRARFQLRPAWHFGGSSHRLLPGRYHWYVWPGFGRVSASRYGKRVASRDFVLTR